jgi:transcriptional regulator with XRE-family HTH domain
MSQADLGSRVGTSQNIISLLESGGIESSQFVIPICRALDISPPTFFETEEERTWWRLGRDLRAKNEAVFQSALSMIKSMVTALGPDLR